MKAMDNVIGRLIVGCVLACWLISNTDAQPTPPDNDTGGDNSGGTYMPDYSGQMVNPGTNLWIAKFAISSSNLVGIISNTIPDIYFEVQSKSDLIHDTQWVSTGFGVYGSELTNWTALVMNNLSRTNKAFFRIRSWADDGSGLPIWWQMQYFGTTGVDPYGDPDGDGWNNLTEFQNGMNPNVFYTPSAPQGLTINSYDSASGTANLSWLPSPGLVTGYIFAAPSGTVYLSASTTNYTDNASPDWASYQIQAQYAGGNSAWSDGVSPRQNAVSASIVPGPQGLGVLAVSALPANTLALRLTRIDELAHFSYGDTSYDISFDIPVPTNGLYSLANEMTVPDAYVFPWLYCDYYWNVQAIDTNGHLSAATGPVPVLWNCYADAQKDVQHTWLVPPYFDGRAQLKQNLIFQLRAATVDAPFHFEDAYSSGFVVGLTNPPNYAYSGFYDFSFVCPPLYEDFPETFLNVLRPFEDNALFRNFVFNLAELNSGGHTTNGVVGDFTRQDIDSLVLQEPAAYQLQFPTVNGAAISALLATNQTQWLATYPLDTPNLAVDGNGNLFSPYLGEIGVSAFTDANWENMFYAMAANARNIYGLPFVSAKIAWGNTGGDTCTLSAGSQVENVDGYFYPETAQPQLQMVEYDFWNANVDALPGATNFSTGQTSSATDCAGGNS